MTVLKFRAKAAPAFNPADLVMQTVRLDAANMPGLYRFIDAYCVNEPIIMSRPANSEAQQEAIKAYVGDRLKQHFNVLRLHPRPYFTHPEDLTDALYCGAAISLLDEKITDKAFKKGKLMGQNHDGLREGRVMAEHVKSVLRLATPDAMEPAFRKLNSKSQFIFVLLACQHVRYYLDIKTSDTTLYNRFLTEGGRKTLIDMRAHLQTFETVLQNNTSAMSDLYRSMMRTIHTLTSIGQRNKIKPV